MKMIIYIMEILKSYYNQSKVVVPSLSRLCKFRKVLARFRLQYN